MSHCESCASEGAAFERERIIALLQEWREEAHGYNVHIVSYTLDEIIALRAAVGERRGDESVRRWVLCWCGWCCRIRCELQHGCRPVVLASWVQVLADVAVVLVVGAGRRRADVSGFLRCRAEGSGCGLWCMRS